MLNYKLLIVSICIVIGLTLYLFYWNRFMGFIFSRVLRLLFWNQRETSIWVDIGSIHFSLLTGRILVKDVVYHSSNQTIRIVKGQISWRYWIRVPAGEEDLSHARVMGEDVGLNAQKTPLSCRLHITLQGLEWFVYNRTAAYDHVLSAMETSTASSMNDTPGRPSGEGIGSLRKIFSWTSVVPDSTHLGPPISLMSSIYGKTPRIFKKWSAGLKRQLPNLDPKDLLPLGIEVLKGAIICGNSSTPELLVSEFRSTRGTYGIVPARSKYDQYKQVLNLTFQSASISFAPNARYQEPMRTSGEKLHSGIQHAGSQPLRTRSYLSFATFGKLWRRYKLWTVTFSRSQGSHGFLHNTGTWPRRRTREADDEPTPLGINFTTLEYAKENKVLEAPFLDLLYYADSVGEVPRTAASEEIPFPTADPLDIGNGDLPPEWGVDIAIRGGVLRYGPWTDRQRALLQQAFFPPTFTDATPMARLKEGDPRVWPCLKILVELRDGVMLQIPFREPSKNWQWDDEVHVPKRPRKREAASIHIRAGDSSTISYTMPMVATARGYEPTLHVHLDTVTVTSSLNDIRVLSAAFCSIRAELPSPLKWNDARQWTFAINLHQPVFYLLRDHINMFTDLSKDWVSGPPASQERFIPMVYKFEIDMQNYEINVYVNDHNIIDKPLIREENALLTLYGKKLQNQVSVPMMKYRPETTMVSFWIESPDVQVRLTLPRWNTRSLYSAPHRNTDIGRIGLLRLDASYSYFAEVYPENIDQLKLSFMAQDVIYKLCGWSIRHFMILRNNYFGSFTHFSTLFEYLTKRRQKQPLGDPVDLQYREGGSNALQIQLEVTILKGLIVMPVGLRGYESDQPGDLEGDIGACIMLALPEMQIHLRSHDYYMELALNQDVISGSIHDHCPEDLITAQQLQRQAKETLVLDGLGIVAHRLFGPLPHTSTYLCIWDIHVGRVMAHLTTIEARTLAAAGQAFGLNFTDPLNAPAAEHEIPADPDVTFLKIKLDEVTAVWHAGDAVAELRLPAGFRMDSNDLAGKLYSKVTSFRVPSASVKLLLSKAARSSEWHEAASMVLDANIDVYSAPQNWRQKAQAQAEFLAAQDGHTCRALFLYMPDQTIRTDTMAPGRGVLDTELYLPQLRIPTSHPPRPSKLRPRKTDDVPGGHHSLVNKQVKRRIRTKSDSEGEDYGPEADRDARLAQLRPPRMPSGQGQDNDSISSGDEEDDDSTDAYGTDSDDDDDHRPGDAHEIWPTIKEYKPILRRYQSRYLMHPSYWHQSPYILLKEPRSPLSSPLTQQLTQWICEAEAETDPEEIGVDFDESIDTSVVRVTSYKPAIIQTTPLILPIIYTFLEDIRHHQLSADLLLDCLVRQHIASIPSEEKKSKRRASAMDIRLCSVQLSLTQAVPPSIEPTDRATFPSKVLVTTALVVDDLSLKSTNVTKGDDSLPIQSVAVEFSKFGCGFSVAGVSDLPWHVLAGPSSASVVGSELQLSLGSVYSETQYSAPEHLVPNALVALRLMNSLRKLLIEHSEYSRSCDQRVALQVIKLVGNRAVFDPLSTTQPSYLVQSGLPHKLRTDVGFKYLVFLRKSFESLQPSERQVLRDATTMPPSEVALEYASDVVQGSLIQLGAELDVLTFPDSSPLAFLRADDILQTASSSTPLHTFALRFHRIHTLYSSSDGNHSELSVAPIILNARTRVAEWFEPHLTLPKSTVSLPLADKAGVGQSMNHLSIIISIGDVAVSFYPSLIDFAQHVIHIMRLHGLFAKGSQSPSCPKLAVDTTSKKPVRYIDIVLSTNIFKVKAGAQNLVIEYKALAVDFVCTALLKPLAGQNRALDVSLNQSLTFREARLQGCALADMSKPNEYAVLAALVFSGGKANVLVRYQPDVGPSIRVALGMRSLHLNVPRSAIRFYRFAQEWREDYLPGIEQTFKALLAELRSQSRSSTPNATPSPTTGPRSTWVPRNLEVFVESFRVSLQVMRGTWVAWEVGSIMSYVSSFPSSRGARRSNFGLQIDSQTFIVSSKDQPSDLVPNVRVKIPLPTFTSTAHFDGDRLDGLVLIDSFSATVKPSHWDTLLTVQQKFGQDFSDLVAFIEDSRPKTPRVNGKDASRSMGSYKYRVQAKMKGFSVALEGISSALLLECDRIGGTVMQTGDGLSGHLELSDLALSLAPRSNPSSPLQSFDRGRRSAFVIIDMTADIGGSQDKDSQLVNFVVSKIHAVMQPSSIGQLGDFVDHLQAEISTRREQRAQDLAEFKEKTKALLRSLDLATSSSKSESLSWLDKYIISIAVKNVGVAFPLTAEDDLQISRSDRLAERPVRAFLFSIRSITFGTHKGESGQASMKGFSFQFVSRFRQSEPADFAGDHHATRNRLIYPEMAAQLKSERTATSRQLHICANVDGFILDLDSTIPDYISSLIEVYRQGKARVDRLAGGSARVQKDDIPLEPESRRATEDGYTNLLTSNVFLSLTFRSGRVRTFSEAFTSSTRSRVISTSSQDPGPGTHFRELGSEIFNLPEVSVWGEYRATPASLKVNGRRRHSEPSTLVFKSTVHSSQNTLRPTLLPFFTEVIDHVETRMKKANMRDTRRLFDASASPAISTIALSRPADSNPSESSDVVSSMQISLSLRIDKSRLELTCQPDVNVIAGVHWDSGGFLVNISPGAHRVSFSGNVGGLSIGLKHGFLSEDCVSLHARDLAFTVDFAKSRGATVSTVSVVCDTEFSGAVRFSRLQDILCFKAVWLDRIPVLNMNVQPSTPATAVSRSTSYLTTASSGTQKQELATAIILRLRKVSLDVDLGQSISSIQLNVLDAVLRSRVTDMEAELSLSVEELHAIASGNLSGRIAVPNFLFETKRKKDRTAKSKMLDLQMTSGPLDITLESEYQKLLMYRAEPLVVRIYDDWSMFGHNISSEHKKIRLTFTIKGSDVTAIMNVGTIPKIVSYANKFKSTLDAQKEGASRESRAFRESNPSKPENPLSDVANAILHSARTRLAEAESGLAYVIGQRLSLKLDMLKLVIFPRNMRDPELAQFIGSNIHARLDRLVESDARPPIRDLQLSFSSISISKLAHLNLSLVAKEQNLDTDSVRWLSLLTKDASEATIFTLPSMDMTMSTEEYLDDGSRVLPYDFSSKFADKKGAKEEDIYITLNMSLYSWLTVLRKTFAREMDQVQAAAEVRPPTLGLVQPTGLRRSKAPEPLQLATPDRDLPLPEPTTADESIQTAKRNTLPHAKSTPARVSTLSPTSSEWIIASPAPLSPPRGREPSGSRTSTLLATAPTEEGSSRAPSPGLPASKKTLGIIYKPRNRRIERLTMRQLGEATPDVMHPFFMKTSGFSLEDSLPQYVHEYATMPTEEIMKALLKLYSKQLHVDPVLEIHS